jgi:D-alanyl-D-alanine carboxypeptidase (penicillin-binding protein 5/6)
MQTNRIGSVPTAVPTFSSRTGEAGSRPYARQKRSAARARQRRIFWRRRLIVLAVAALAVAGFDWVVSAPGSRGFVASADQGTLGLQQVTVPSIVPVFARETKIPGALSPLPFPAVGESAVLVRGVGLLGATADEASVPIASVTKVMTATIVLRDHPIGSGSGPIFTMTEADHEAWIQAVANGDSTLEVVPGERLSERQLLEALMMPSADNIADYLARWDAGSVAAFVRKMNATAARLGLRQTHYADASGVNPGSRSNAIDQAILAAYAMSVPGMVSVEDHPGWSFPVEGAAPNYNPVIGQDGVIGLKSGFTDAAQICLVTAARRRVGQRVVLVISVTLGQPSSLAAAGDIDLQLLDAATADLGVHDIVPAFEPVATVSAPWTHKHLDLFITKHLTVVAWPGLVVSTVLKPDIPIKPGAGRGWNPLTKMASVEVSTALGIQQVEPAKLSGFLPSAPAGWSPHAASTSTTVAASN